MTNLYLAHHGIKGQKWGVRRYQNPDGSLTEAGKQRYKEYRNIVRNKPYTDDVNSIVKTLSNKEKDLLGAEKNKDWIEKKYENDTLKEKAATFIQKEGKTPISFVEIWTNGGHTGQIALATRNDPEYRGKGYASKNVEEALKWVNKYGKKSIDELEWIVDRENKPSINLAKKYGFEENTPEKWKDWEKDFMFLYKKV